MTIKTAVTLVMGAAVGFLFGLETSEKTKERIVSSIKGKIFYALTGEKMPQKKPVVTYGGVNYANFRKAENDVLKYDWNKIKKDIFEFENHEDAEKFLSEMLLYAENFGTVSIVEACSARGLDKTPINFNDAIHYGWLYKEVCEWRICELKQNNTYWIPVANPKYL